jgi:hypothetical protein
VSLTVTEMVAKLGLDIDEGEFAQGDKALEELRAAILGLAGVATAAATAIGAMIASTVESASAADDASKATGVSAQALIELGHAAQMSGSSAEELRDGLLHLSRSSVAAASGSAEGAEAFRKFGVSVRDGAGRLKGADALLAEVADGLGRIPEAERASAAMAIFGRSGARLVPLLSEGAGGIALLRREARELGIVLDAETIEAAASLGDSFDRAKASLKAFAYVVATPLLKPLKRVIETLVAWWKANQTLIQQRVDTFWARVVPILEAAGSAFAAMGRAVLWAYDHLREFAVLLSGVVLGALWANIGALMTQAMWAVLVGNFMLGAAVKAAAAWLVATGPFILLGVLIALLAEDIWVFVEGGESAIGEFVAGVTELWAALKTATIAAFSAVRDFVGGIFDGVMARVQSAMAWVSEKLEVAQKLYSKVFGDASVDVLARGVAELSTTPGGVSAAFGGGASPAASVTNNSQARSTAITTNVELTVNAAPGQSAQEVGRVAVGGMTDYGRSLAEAAAAAGGG